MSSCCGATGLVVSWECWDTGSIPSPAQWVKDLALLKLWLRWRLQLGSDPWFGSSICWGWEGGENLFIIVILQCCANFWVWEKWLSQTNIYILKYMCFLYSMWWNGRYTWSTLLITEVYGYEIDMYELNKLFFFKNSIFFFVFLGPHLRHVEVLRQGVESEL